MYLESFNNSHDITNFVPIATARKHNLFVNSEVTLGN
jgi:hypothetical protein